MKNKKIVYISILFSFFVLSNTALAHTAVSPTQAEVDTFETFTLSTHPEKNSPIVKTRLILPSEIKYVTPFLKPGWKIDLVKEEDNTTERPQIREIIWSGVNIPPDFHEEFTFSAKLPPTETKVNWRIEQTFADKSVIAFDLNPDAAVTNDHPHSDDHDLMSQTTVIKKPTPSSEKKVTGVLPIGLSAIALLVSLASLLRKK